VVDPRSADDQLAAVPAGLGGQVVLVSGAARPPGLGRATARLLAAAGADVVCADVVGAGDTGLADPDAFDHMVADVEAAAASGGGQVFAVRQDEVGGAGYAAVVDAAVSRFGRLDACCVLNGATGAGAGDGPLLDLGEASWRRCLEMNLVGGLLLAQQAARAMIAGGRGGSIVHLSSHAGTAPTRGAGAVGAARAAINQLVRVLAVELGPFGIRVNAVAPLAVEPAAGFPNPGLLALAERDGIPYPEWIARSIPLGRSQRADETAAVIAFLCSGAASFVSGVVVPVNGGSG
jgi:NAD(P)-dependent dehydrogenase (short-subunit alcohol dehydrogenase family)